MTIAAEPAEQSERAGADRQARQVELPKINPHIRKWFLWYLQRYFRKNFHSVRVATADRPKIGADQPLIVYSNHPSWWDPIVLLYVMRAYLPAHDLYGPMDAEALERYAIFKRLGIFGVERDTRSGAATFLRVGQQVLQTPGSLLCVTAEGEFRDPRVRPIEIKPGIAHLIRRCPDATVLPLAMELSFWSERDPEVLLRFGSPVSLDAEQRGSTEALQAHLAGALEATMDALAASVKQRDATAFDVLIAGDGGVNVLYDLWRRFVALLTGRDFQSEHQESLK